MYTHQVFPEDTLVLSLAWNPNNAAGLGVSLSTSDIVHLEFNADRSTLDIVPQDNEDMTHDGLEAWTVAFASPDKGTSERRSPSSLTTYSGGDDGRLRSTTIATQQNGDILESNVVATSPPRGFPGHDAGVTAILPLPLATEPGQEILLTGSYDDYIRVYATYDHRDSASNTRPKPIAELKIGGGVWRLTFLHKFHNQATGRPVPWQTSQDPVTHGSEKEACFQVLASCMHAGARVLEVKGSLTGEWTIEELGRFEEHKSMNYASDVQPRTIGQDSKNGSVLCISSSFYDRLLCLWRFEDNRT